MKATEQLSSLEMMSIDPLRRIVSPRFWAGLISLPLLSLLFSLVGIYGGKLVGVDWLGADEGSFWAGMQAAVDLVDAKMHEIAEDLVARPLPVDATARVELQEFLRWAANDHFTFLGYRDYVLKDHTKVYMVQT